MNILKKTLVRPQCLYFVWLKLILPHQIRKQKLWLFRCLKRTGLKPWKFIPNLLFIDREATLITKECRRSLLLLVSNSSTRCHLEGRAGQFGVLFYGFGHPASSPSQVGTPQHSKDFLLLHCTMGGSMLGAGRGWQLISCHSETLTLLPKLCNS